MAAKLSFEIFPPNTSVGLAKILPVLEELKGLQPEFISVTCSNNKQNILETTVRLADYVKNELGIETFAHLPAVYLDQQEVRGVLKALDQIGVKNLLALRGDVVEGIASKRDFPYASHLIDFVKEVQPNFKIGGACYPEVHPESPSQISDIKFLKQKVDAGCDLLISQLFFDNEVFYDFYEKCQLAGIEVPILAGIMPVINRPQILRLLKTCQSTRLPKKFKAILEKYEHDPESLKQAGLAYAVDQIADLITNNVAGIHLYTMNKSETAKHIYQTTSHLFKHTEGVL